MRRRSRYRVGGRNAPSVQWFRRTRSGVPRGTSAAFAAPRSGVPRGTSAAFAAPRSGVPRGTSAAFAAPRSGVPRGTSAAFAAPRSGVLVEYPVGQLRPAPRGPVAEPAVGQAGTGQPGDRVDPQERAGLPEVAEGTGGVVLPGPVRPLAVADL